VVLGNKWDCGKLEIKIRVSELGNLNIVNFRCWKFGILQFRLLKIIQVLSVCALFPHVLWGEGWWWSGKATGSVPQHARFRILQTSSIRSEDPDLEKLTNIYLRICVCVQFSRPINQQDKQTVLRTGMPSALLCVAGELAGQGHAYLVSQGSWELWLYDPSEGTASSSWGGVRAWWPCVLHRNGCSH